MTMGFVALLSVYCVYDFVRFVLFERPRLTIAAASDEQAFSNSLAKFAQVHAPSQAVIQPSGAEQKQKSADAVVHEMPSRRA